MQKRLSQQVVRKVRSGTQIVTSYNMVFLALLGAEIAGGHYNMLLPLQGA